MDILVLAGIVSRLGCGSISLLHVQSERLGLDGLIRILAGIIIGELHGWNGIAALIARNSQEIVNHITLHSIGGESGLICYLGIILVEILREIHYWLLQQLEVSNTSHNHTERNRFACLDFLLVKTSRDIELTYSPREIGWALWQRIYLQGDTRSLDVLLYLYISGTAIEEGLHRVNIAVLLYHDALEGDGRNLQLTGHLRIHHILAPGDTLVRATIHHFGMESLLLWQRYFLVVESLQVWHLAFQLGEFHLCIYLVGKQDRFLLVYSLLVGRHLDEEVAA